MLFGSVQVRYYRIMVIVCAKYGRLKLLNLFLPPAKPYPPTGVKIRRNTSPHVYFQYDIHWTKPEQHGWSITNYTVQTLALLDGTAAHFCSCVDHRSDESVTVFNFQAGCPGSSLALDHYLYYRVAVNTVAAGQSAFMSGHLITITAGDTIASFQAFRTARSYCYFTALNPKSTVAKSPC